MSTRSYILIETKKSKFKGVYCHWDGYIEWNGFILQNYYQDRQKVEKLISLGGLSSLRVNIEPTNNEPHSFENPQKTVCIFYTRDRGEKWSWNKPKNMTLKKANDSDADYVYVYRLNGEWQYFKTQWYYEKRVRLENLKEAVDKANVDTPEFRKYLEEGE